VLLVPIDYSEPSRCAFDLACRLAGNGAGQLTLVHVADPPQMSSLGMMAGPPLPAGYRGAWESQLRLIRPRDPAVQVEYRIEEGGPATAILRAAGQIGCDLIVMGARRNASLGGLLRRSVSRRVSRQAPCPVLTLTLPPAGPSTEGRPPDVRATASDSSRRAGMLDYRTILHPTDFSESAMYAFGLARDLARGFGGHLLVAHVAPARLYRKRRYWRERGEALRRLTTSDPEVRMQGLLLAGDPASQIVSTATQTDCGLIVMGTSGRTGLGRMWHGSVAGAVRDRARCPVLTARLPDGAGWGVPDFAAGGPVTNGRTPAAGTAVA
jgi:nucleotide-binding universal stress UspA family protein